MEYIALLWKYNGDRYYVRPHKGEEFADFKNRVYKDFPNYTAEFYEITPKY